MASETLEVTAPAPADAPAPPAEETPEEIEARLQRTQEALAGKLDVLEQQTLGTIRDTLGAVTDTVNTVQNVVNDPVAAVQSAVMNPIGDVAAGVSSSVTDMVQKFDPTDLIRKHPFESVGVAVAGGVVVGMLFNARPATTAGGGGGFLSGLLQPIASSVSSELAVLGRQLFETVSQSLKERVQQALSVSPPPSPPPPYSV
jgi:ElaB/YqjD/DUF883 family membrane-anchored ribosome-binding protein